MSDHPNILAHWLAFSRRHAAGYQDVDALADLNEALGTHHSQARLYEWKTGRRPIPREVARWCAMDGGLAHVLQEQKVIQLASEVTDEQLAAIADAFLP